MQEADAKQLDSLLKRQSYVSGFVPSSLDAENWEAARTTRFASSAYPHLSRWFGHISSFPAAERRAWPGVMSPPTSKDADGGAAADESALPLTLLRLLRDRDALESQTVAAELGVEHQRVVGAVKSLASLGSVVELEQGSARRLELTAEGAAVADLGSHEARLFAAVPSGAGGILHAELMKAVPNANIGFSKAMSASWIALDKKASGGARVTRKAESIDDDVKNCLLQVRALNLDSVDAAKIAELKKRKLLAEVSFAAFTVRKGAEFSLEISKPETDLTAEMMLNQSWRSARFKAYNFDALGAPQECGHLHPLLKVRAEIRQIFFELGFEEMATNNYVESSFWNFDALFQPQQHPARDAHDTFFVSSPAACSDADFPADYMERVKTVHSVGGYGSQGYGYDWKVEDARKNLLRTHTTAVSARMLYKLAQQSPFRPAKYFSIDRVFRNETLDATHLAEFHQVEGVVADRNLTLAHLIGTLHEFFNKLGLKKLRFKPTYNPYTEPSMEVFSYHEGLGKWVEVGNTGVFRPEMLLPMGLPEDVTVIAWGLSLERPTMIRYGVDNIRDLFGPRVNLKMVYDNPICRLDKD